MIGSRSPHRRVLLAGWMIFLPFAPAGCDSQGAKHPIVEGKVTVDGSPANSGNVVFTSADGKSIAGIIQPDGTYRAVDVPLGAVKVFVKPPSPEEVARYKKQKKTPPAPKMPKVPEGPAGSLVPIPQKYTDANSSGLTTTIKPGTNTYDIEMTSK
jgi:hypothetical protein